MSDKFESELVSLLEMRYSDNPYNHPNMYSNFFESNKEELKNSSIWDEIRNIASDVLAYKVNYGMYHLVDDFFEELHFHYDLWSRMSNNL